MCQCLKCKRTLTGDEIGITKKLMGRGILDYYCKECLAMEFKCDVRLIDEKIRQLKELGCLLFV